MAWSLSGQRPSLPVPSALCLVLCPISGEGLCFHYMRHILVRHCAGGGSGFIYSHNLFSERLLERRERFEAFTV